MAFPTLTEIKEYLSVLGLTYDDSVIVDAMAAEKSSQASVCKVPVTDEEEWPAPLVAAYKRRVARHLKMGPITVGIVEFADSAMRISGLDAETRRLEAPYKRIRSFGV